MKSSEAAQSPLVSIITPAHNAEKSIEETIQSVLRQSFKSFEMLIVDDHSTDQTIDIVQHYAKQDPRIRLFFQEQDMKGAAAARNKAISEASGRYIAFLDSDDLWHPEKLKKQISFMQLEGEVFCYTRYFKIDQNSNLVGSFENIPERLRYRDLLRTCPIGCLTAVYDTAHFGKVYMPDIPRGQDYGLWLQLLRMYPTARLLPETLAYYRIGRSNSVSSAKFKKAVSIWRLYRKYEKMNRISAAFHLVQHSLNSLRK